MQTLDRQGALTKSHMGFTQEKLMNTKLLILFLVVCFLQILTACGGQSAPAGTSAPTDASVPTQAPMPLSSLTQNIPTETRISAQAPMPLPSATPHIPIAELVRQNGFVLYQIENLQETTLSFWLPNTFVDNSMRFESWRGGWFLEDASDLADDYAYDIYAENVLFTAYDTARCTESTSISDLPIEFAVRTGQDEQLSRMTIENYTGLLAIAIKNMRGAPNFPGYSSERFEVPGFEAWRITANFQTMTEGYEYVTFIDYILKKEDRIWVLTFSVDTEMFIEQGDCANLLNNFDLTARSFQVSTTEMPTQVSNTEIPKPANTLIPLIRPTATIAIPPSPTPPPTPESGGFSGFDYGVWDLYFYYDEEGVKKFKLEIAVQTVDLVKYTCKISQFSDAVIPVRDSQSEPGSRTFQAGSLESGILIHGALYGCPDYYNSSCSSAIINYSIWECGNSKELIYTPWEGEITVTNH